jgi:hypothetical protein
LVLQAQEFPSDSTRNPKPSRTSLAFERNTNTFRWNLQGRYSAEILGWITETEERFLRTMIQSARQNFKDENTFRFSLTKNILSDVDLVTSFSSFIFSDQFSLGLNDVSLNAVTEGVRWNILDDLSVNSSAGIAFDRQQGILDKGFVYEGDALLRSLAFGESKLAGGIYLKGELISPRFQEEQRATAELRTALSRSSLHDIRLSFRKIRRDFYLQADSAIASLFHVLNPVSSRTEQLLTLSDQIDYEILTPLLLHGGIDISQRTIFNAQQYHDPGAISPIFDSDIKEFRLMGNLFLRYDNRTGSAGIIRFEINERDETHTIGKFEGANLIAYSKQARLEEQKNNTIYQTQIAFDLSQTVGSMDTLFVAGSSVKLEYNTPDNNPDDRDELFLLSSARWSHRLHDHVLSSLTGEVSFRHIVYLFSERSANNSWNRVFRIAPAVTVRYPDIVSINSAEVIGNYTTYDFEEFNPDLQSFALRLMVLSDSTDLRLSRSYWFRTTLMLRMYEQGELHWNRFTVHPTTFFREQTLALSIVKKSDSWVLSVGIRYFEQRRYKFNEQEKMIDNILISYGPTVQVVLPTSAKAGIQIEGWYQLTRENAQSMRKTPNITISMVWNI